MNKKSFSKVIVLKILYHYLLFLPKKMKINKMNIQIYLLKMIKIIQTLKFQKIRIPKIFNHKKVCQKLIKQINKKMNIFQI